MPSKEIWNQCLAAVGDKVSQQSFDIWLKPLKLVKVTDDTIDLEVPNKFFKDWISENYESLIKDILYQITKNQYAVHFHLNEKIEEKETKAKAAQPSPASHLPRQAAKEDGLNPAYTFEAFVVGS